MNQIPIALQMYTLRNEAEKDFIGTLNKVAELGFDGVEFAGYGGMEAAELRKVLDQEGLQAASSHIPIAELENDLEKVIQDQIVLGSRYIVCPWIPEDQRTEKDYWKLIKLLNTAGERCHQEGISLCYHHHDFELEKLSDGRTVLQTIFEETNPDWVKAEFDIYWLTYAGEEPADWITRYQERSPIVHLKDMTTDGTKFFAELGTGGVDLDSVLALGEESRIKWWVVEQDESRKSPLESVGDSLKYLKQQ